MPAPRDIRRTALLAWLGVAALLVPAAADAATVTVRPLVAPADAPRVLTIGPGVAPTAGRRPAPFRLAGLRWRGARGAVFRLRARATDGGWGRWTEIEATDDHEVDEARDGAHVSEPLWVGRADDLQVRVLRGRVTGVEAVLVDPGSVAAPAGSRPAATRAARRGAVPRPRIISRAEWGADERLRRGAPRVAPRLRFAVVHHTAGSNSYGPTESAAVVRAIHAYHVRSNGWNDIGYSYLVDRYGQVFEGRAGGVEADVIGAHAGGFNTGSVGVSLIGSYEHESPPDAQLRALEQLLAWRLDLAHVDPRSRLDVVSGGNELHRAGRVVRLDAVSGHRDTGRTSCPGAQLFARLPAIREAVDVLGGLRIFEPAVTPTGLPVGPDGRPRPVRITARLSAPAAWQVRILAADGAVVATLAGVGTAVDATWSGAPDPGRALPASLVGLRWRIEAGDPAASALPAEGSFDTTAPEPVRTPAVTIADVRADPDVLTPNGDGVGDGGRVAWKQSVAGRVRIAVVDARGVEVAVPLDLPDVGAGAQSAPWDGRGPGGAPLPSGRYRYRLEMQPSTPFALPVSTTTPVTLRRGAGPLTVSPTLTPNGDGRHDRAVIRFDRLEPGPFEVRLWRRGRLVRTLAAVPGWQGPWELSWDGAGVRDGAYLVQLVTPGPGGTLLQRAPILVDRRPPVLAVRRVVRPRGRVVVRIGLSEAATVHVGGGGRTLAAARRAGGPSSLTFARRRLRGVRFLYLRAVDAAGTPGRRIRIRV